MALHLPSWLDLIIVDRDSSLEKNEASFTGKGARNITLVERHGKSGSLFDALADMGGISAGCT